MATCVASVAAPLVDAPGGTGPFRVAFPSVERLGAQPAANGIGAERSSVDGRTPRKLTFSVAGALIGASLAYAYDRLSLGGARASRCDPRSCAFPYLTFAGTLAGFFVGYERDLAYGLQYRYGPPVEFRSSSLAFRGEPLALALWDTLVAVAGAEGVHVVTAGPRLRSAALRAAGFAGITDVAFIGRGAGLGVATGQSVAILPPLDGRGVLVREQGAEVLVAHRAGLFVAVRDSVEWIADAATMDSVGPWPAVGLGARARGGTADPRRDAVWIATDSAVVLVGVRDGVPRELGRMATPFPARAVSVDATGQRLAVALGNRGVMIVALNADGAARGDALTWSAAQFAYDVAWIEDELFVAAGTEGLYRLAVDAAAVRATGLARGAGFPTVVRSQGTQLFLLDRSGRALVRLEP